LLHRDSIIDVRLGDQIEKTVTILFSDIRGYTTISESMTPKENFDFLNQYLKNLGPAIRQNNGFISHYYGDGIMALFPTPSDGLQASLSMMDQVKSFNKKLSENNNDQIQVGIGLHSGPSMLGILGDEERMDASLVSDAVNIASRMEGLTKFYSAQIVVSESTINQIEEKDNYLHRFLGRVLVKGKTRITNVIEIFQADDPDIREMKTKTKSDFEKGLELYFTKDFTQAAAFFKKVTDLNPNDSAAKFYISNSAKHMVEGVAEDWEGVENLEFK
jgi:two-component system sensor histidine kinase ChiS